ncbi:MAG: DinB family protein [Bacteroidetes bacterium]|nr:DinB family protein [Bacteroidota bacterium]
MKKLAMLFTLVVTVFACITARAQVNKDQMIADWQRAKAFTKAYLDAMPEDGYKSVKPTPEMRSFAGQMLHIADGNYFLIGSVTGKPGPLKGSAEQLIPQTKEATTKAVMDSYDYVINLLQTLTPEQMQAKGKVEGAEITASVAFNKAFEHQTHHRGQTVAYLRLKGVTPPGEMLF